MMTANHSHAEPVNARLLEALLYWRDECSGAEPSISAFSLMVDEAIAAAEAQQERNLQDMHDAGREIDRVMAEPAQKAARLTEDDLEECKRLADAGSPVPRMSWAQRLAFAVETAVLRKNGFPTDGSDAT